MSDLQQKNLFARVGKVTAILSSATLSLLVVGAGCAPAPAANVSVDIESPVNVPPASAPTEAPDESATEPSATVPANKYKNGSYDAEGYYRSPAGTEKVGVTLEVEDDTVVGVTFTAHATHPKSAAMQAAFKGGISAVVVGKSLDEIDVGVVSGSSLTGIGFDEAVAKIKLEAQS